MREADRAANLDAILRQIDDLFDQSEAIVRRGEREFFADDFVLRNAAAGIVIRLGEAAKTLPREYVEAHPEVRYRQLIAMRDVVAHAYDSTDWHLVWAALAERHPEDARTHRSRSPR